METIVQFLRRLGLTNRLIPLITAISLVFSLVAGLSPTPAPRDEVINVIYLIGDGMGENHLELARQELGIEFVMDTMPVRGQTKTRSFSSAVTDSAAAGTALACGVRTNNGAIGVYPYDLFALYAYPANLTELAMEKGMKTGVVVTDTNTGATPAAFSSHTSARGNAAIIASQQVVSGIDLIWGAANNETKRTDIEANGYAYVASYSELTQLTPGTRSFGQFNGSDLWKIANDSDTPTLSQMTEKAIELLDNDAGFFLMIEGSHIDKHSHSNKVAETVECVREFDNAVRAALEFAQRDGNTLVVVTADHETGAVTLKNSTYVFTSGSHSKANVPLFVYGSSNFIQNGQAVKNTEVARFIALSMGFGAYEFPRKVLVNDLAA